MVITPIYYMGSRHKQILLVRISLMRFFEIFNKYLPYANFELFISSVQFFGQKMAGVDLIVPKWPGHLI